MEGPDSHREGEGTAWGQSSTDWSSTDGHANKRRLARISQPSCPAFSQRLRESV